MKHFSMLLLTAISVLAAEPRIHFSKSFPGSTPAFVAITVERDGAGTYKETPDDDPETFKLEPAVTMAMFDLAEKMGHFKGTLESGMKVANMGQKIFAWENGSEKNEQKFNYSLDENARLLQDWFERITESETLAAQLKRTVRYDRLGANDVVLKLNIAWDKKRLVSLEQFLPLLDRIAGNEQYMNMARDRARQLAAAFRDSLKVPAQ